MQQDEISPQDIIEMAKEAGASTMISKDSVEKALTSTAKIVAFAKLVAEAAAAKAVEREREACAKLVEGLPPVGEYRQLERAAFKDAATAIRARGSNE